MIKKLAILCLLLFSSISFSQLAAVNSKHEAYQQFLKTKTYVVKSGNSIYDKILLEEMTKVWKKTEFEVISEKQFESKISDPKASFLMLVIIQSSKPYHYFALFNGGKKKWSKYTYEDMLAYCPINFYQNEQKLTTCHYRIKNMLQSMIQAMQIVEEKGMKGSPLKLATQLQDVYNSKSKQIKDRTLLFCDETIKGLKKADIAAVYPYKFEIVKKDKIQEVIANGDDQYYYYQPGITLNKSMFVFDPASGEVVYFSFKMQGLKIKKKDIEELVSAIKTGKI